MPALAACWRGGTGAAGMPAIAVEVGADDGVREVEPLLVAIQRAITLPVPAMPSKPIISGVSVNRLPATMNTYSSPQTVIMVQTKVCHSDRLGSPSAPMNSPENHALPPAASVRSCLPRNSISDPSSVTTMTVAAAAAHGRDTAVNEPTAA